MIELLMAIGITSVLGLTVAGVGMGISNAYNTNESHYECMQLGRTTLATLQGQVEGAKLVGYASGSQLILWASDANNDCNINLNEIQIVKLGGGTATCYQVDLSSLSPSQQAAMNVTVPLATLLAPNTAWTTVGKNVYCKSTTIATGLVNLAFAANLPAASPKARMVSIDVTVGDGSTNWTLHSGAISRADVTQYITANAQGVWTMGISYD
jgi:hypothetical protein